MSHDTNMDENHINQSLAKKKAINKLIIGYNYVNYLLCLFYRNKQRIKHTIYYKQFFSSKMY
jgi:hypothetical protein